MRARREALEAEAEQQESRGVAAIGGTLVRRTADGVRGVGVATANTVREHPIASSVVGAGVAAGLTALAVRSARGATGGSRSSRRQKAQPGMIERAREAMGSATETVSEALTDAVDAVRDGASELGEYAENGLHRAGDALRTGTAAVGEGIGRGYEYTREKAGDLFQNHPLLVTAGFLALGITAGLLLPGTRAEAEVLGDAAGELTKRVKSRGRELLNEGREVVGRVASETRDALRAEANREGLSPDKLAGKVKRIAGRLKDVVSDAAEG